MVSMSVYFLACAAVFVGAVNAVPVVPAQKQLCFATPLCLVFKVGCPPCYTNPGGSSSGSLPGGSVGGTGGFTPASTAQFNTDTIAATNAKRAQDCAAPVTEDATLTAAAQAYANKLAATGAWAHSPEAMGGQYGENLAMQCFATVNPNTAVDGWYNEKRYYTKGGGIIVSGA